MRKLLCPACKVGVFFVLNDEGERRIVYVNEKYEVVAKHPEESLEGFDLSIVHCIGCSWKGSPKRLVRY